MYDICKYLSQSDTIRNYLHAFPKRPSDTLLSYEISTEIMFDVERVLKIEDEEKNLTHSF